MTIKIDLHTHSCFSRHPIFKSEAFGTPRQMIDIAIKKGLDGLAITDHDSVRGALEGMEYARRRNFFLVPGTEVSSAGGHILALGVRKDIARGLSIAETIRRIHRLGGLAVAPHPYVGWPRKSSLKDSIRDYKFDAIEVLNGGARVSANKRAYNVAKEMGIPYLAGSDSHHRKDIGFIYNIIDCEPTISSLFRAIKEGRVRVKGRPFGLYSKMRLVVRKINKSVGSRI